MGKRTVVPLCGVDDSMVGFTINGWEIKKLLPTSESCTIVDEIKDIDLYRMIGNVLDMEDILSIISFKNNIKNPYHLVFTKETDDVSEIEPIVDILRVFKSSGFGCLNPFVFEHGNFVFPETGCSYITNELQICEKLSLSENERSAVASFLKKRNQKEYPEIVDRMLLFFHESCRLSDLFVSFVIRITILEMLIDGNTELSYRLRHSVAVLLGKSVEESEKIAGDFKKAYNARSKFLHEGDSKKVTDEIMDIGYEYSRRIIANLLFITDDIKTIRKKLEQSGYGSNPYIVSF